MQQQYQATTYGSFRNCTSKIICFHGLILLLIMETMTRKYVFWHGNLNVKYLLKWNRQRLSLHCSRLSFRTQTGNVTFDTEIKSQESDKNRKKTTMHTSPANKDQIFIFIQHLLSVFMHKSPCHSLSSWRFHNTPHLELHSSSAWWLTSRKCLKAWPWAYFMHIKKTTWEMPSQYSHSNISNTHDWSRHWILFLNIILQNNLPALTATQNTIKKM